jgi:hypothetical protein
MNTKNLWIVALSGGVLTTLVSNLPYISFINCLVCGGFWGSAIFAVWLYRRLSGTLTVRQGVRIGLITGLCAGVLGFALSFAGLSGIQGILNSVNQALPPDASQNMEGIPSWGLVLINLVGVLFNVVFGAIGGWIGASIFRTDRIAESE